MSFVQWRLRPKPCRLLVVCQLMASVFIPLVRNKTGSRAAMLLVGRSGVRFYHALIRDLWIDPYKSVCYPVLATGRGVLGSQTRQWKPPGVTEIISYCLNPQAHPPPFSVNFVLVMSKCLLIVLILPGRCDIGNYWELGHSDDVSDPIWSDPRAGHASLEENSMCGVSAIVWPAFAFFNSMKITQTGLFINDKI